MEICIGTAQFGLDYGISNITGKVSADTVHLILNKAYEKGIKHIETAPYYGDSEELTGQGTKELNDVRITTKLMPLRKKRVNSVDITRLRQTFIRSLRRLNKENVNGVMINNISEITVDGGYKILDLLKEYKYKGYIKKIGIFLNHPIEIECINNFDVFDFAQIPLNVLDQRFINNGSMDKLKRQGLEIFVRSIFLQGLLLMHPDNIDSFFRPVVPIIKLYHKFLASNNLSLLEGAFCFISQVKGIDVMLWGLTSEKELDEDLAAYEKCRNIPMDFSAFSIENEDMLNPSKWRIR